MTPWISDKGINTRMESDQIARRTGIRSAELSLRGRKAVANHSCGCRSRFSCLYRRLEAQVDEMGLDELNAPLPGEQVYFIGSNDGPVKIGRSTSVQSRLASIQTGSPIPLAILAVVPGGRNIERAYHQHFAEYRLHGEWFAMSPGLRQEISRHAW